MPGVPLRPKILPGPPSGPPKFSAWRHATGVGLFLKVLHRPLTAPLVAKPALQWPPKWKCLAPPLFVPLEKFNIPPLGKILPTPVYTVFDWITWLQLLILIKCNSEKRWLSRAYNALPSIFLCFHALNFLLELFHFFGIYATLKKFLVKTFLALIFVSRKWQTFLLVSFDISSPDKVLISTVSVLHVLKKDKAFVQQKNTAFLSKSVQSRKTSDSHASICGITHG